MEHFHTYTYGRRNVAQTDHKPPVIIARKPLSDVPKRLQKLMIIFQKYDYELVYLPGSQMVIADALSRACAPDDGGCPPEFDHVSMIGWSSVNNEDLTKIQEATRNDVVFAAFRALPLWVA